MRSCRCDLIIIGACGFTLCAMNQVTWIQVRMDGSDGSTDLRMSIPDSSGCFVRTTAKRDGSLLLIGELHRRLWVS